MMMEMHPLLHGKRGLTMAGVDQAIARPNQSRSRHRDLLSSGARSAKLPGNSA